MRFKAAAKRILIYLTLVLVAFLLEYSVIPAFNIFSSIPNLLLIVTFSYGFLYGSTTGIICGVFSGFLLDTFYVVLFGINMLIFSFIGFLSGLFKSQLKPDTIYFPLFLCVSFEFIYNVFMMFYRFLLYGRFDPGYTFINVFLPETFFSLLVTLVSYRILLAATRKLDDMDNVRGENAA